MAWFAAQVFADFGSEPASVWVIPIYTGTGPPPLYPRFDLVYLPLYPRSFSFPPPLGPSLASDIDGDPDIRSNLTSPPTLKGIPPSPSDLSSIRTSSGTPPASASQR